MNKPLARPLIYIHGTNGSGKSTLARAVLHAAGGPTGICKLQNHKKVTYTTTAQPVMFAGTYGTACGGVDGLNPYAGIHDVVAAAVGWNRALFAEGLVTPGLDTCLRLADKMPAHYIFLNTPVEQCVANVLKRRAASGRNYSTAYDPANLYKKLRSAESWANRLAAAGLTVHVLQWAQAYEQSLSLLDLTTPAP